MKQVAVNAVSDKLCHKISVYKDLDEYLNTKANIADVFGIVLETMAEDLNDSERMVKWNSVICVMTEYQSLIDLFREEATRE